MSVMQEASAETSLEERIAQINVKSCSVRDMTKLLWDITGEEKWVTREYYQAFAVRNSYDSYVSRSGCLCYQM
jgi:hypothetical protein